MKKRIPFIFGFVLLTGIEVIIGIFFRDGFIRNYLGDIIIEWVIYCFVRIIVPDKLNSYILASGIMIFSFAVEFMQKIHIVDILGINNVFLRILIGTSFSVKDIYCYIAGTVTEVIFIFLYNKKAVRF